MEFIWISLGILIGLTIGILFARIYWRQIDSVPVEKYTEVKSLEATAQERAKSLEMVRQNLADALEKSRRQEIELTSKTSSIESSRDQLSRANQSLLADLERNTTQLDELRTLGSDLRAKNASLESEKKHLERQLSDQKENFEKVLAQSKIEFENLANKILDVKTQKLSDHATQNIDNVLKPLKEKLSTFEKSVDEKYSTEAKERHALKSEIERLIGLNDKMTKETQSLTQALKGDNKIMGDWGELVLEKILEASGLREGHEFSKQESHEGIEGERMRPDIIINLPEGKHVVVDSKMSLKAYELYSRCEDHKVRDELLGSHLKSVLKHIEDLGSKHYSKLKGVNSPELVFLFVPLEPAYLVAMQSDPELSAKAWKRGVAIVTSTTLLVSLKTVASLWRLEKQNKNALEIANEGGKLYDKFVGFLEDFEKIGKIFDNGQNQFASAMGKLKDGPGNVFRKMELLRELGAAPAKRLPAHVSE